MKSRVFVSYSHKDEPDPSRVHWLRYVLSHLKQIGGDADIEAWADIDLTGSQDWIKRTDMASSARPKQSGGDVDTEVWADTDSMGGQDWRKRIDMALEACDIFVFLVSRHSLASEFITKTEVPKILARQEAAGSTEYPLIFPILLTPCDAARTTSWLQVPIMRPKGGQSLSEFALAEEKNARDRVMTEIAQELRKIASVQTLKLTRKKLETAPSVLVPTVSAEGQQVVFGEFDRPSQTPGIVNLDLGFAPRAWAPVRVKGKNLGRVEFSIKAAKLDVKVSGGLITKPVADFAKGYTPPKVKVVQQSGGKTQRSYYISSFCDMPLEGQVLCDKGDVGSVKLFEIENHGSETAITGQIKIEISGIELYRILGEFGTATGSCSMAMKKIAELIIKKHGHFFVKEYGK